MQTTATPLLSEVLHGLAEAPDLAIRGCASDSRRIANDFLFLAVQGEASHGLDYVDEAIAAGAIAVAWDVDTAKHEPNCSVPTFAIDGLGSRLGEIANRFYGQPSANLDVVAVTGTNGKTTVAWMLAECLRELGRPCGYVGTLGVGVSEIHAIDGMTTPAAIDLHGHLADFVAAGAAHAAIEVSSHALSQNRIDGVQIDAALFTNLTRDHLDYHGDMQSYFDAKALLFADNVTRCKIINVDSEFGATLAARVGAEAIQVSTLEIPVADRYVAVGECRVVAAGFDVSVSTSWGNADFTLRLPGDFNVANAMIVLAHLLEKGVGLQRSCEALAKMTAPPGRMQRVACQDPTVYVDYAHTPDAISQALQALRQHCRGQLWCVLGCGGDRDRGKRPLMARQAEANADRIVITNDNPRNESPQVIVDDMFGGLSQPADATMIEDRAAAIAWAVAQAAENDTILIAGKGHEAVQLIGEKRLPFSDFAVATAALQAREIGA